MTNMPEISEGFRKVSEILIDLADMVEDFAGELEVLGERLQCLIDNGTVSELAVWRMCARTWCVVSEQAATASRAVSARPAPRR